MQEKKENRGGARKNAGRPLSGKVKFEVWAKPENKKMIREWVKLNNF